MTDQTYGPAAREWLMTRLQTCLIACASLILLADWLFYGRRLGISVLLFMVALGAFSLIANGLNARRKEIATAVAILIVALIPLVESTNLLALAFGAAGVSAFALMVSGHWQGALATRLWAMLGLYAAGPWRSAAAALHEHRGRRVIGQRQTLLGRLSLWIVPLLLCGVFLMLFASANPLIDRWLHAIDIYALLGILDSSRMIFWLIVAGLTWPLLYVTARKQRVAKVPAAKLETTEAEEKPAGLALLSDGTILRSLVLFNLLFAMQSSMDAAYLWGGVALPDGMSYAAYAHRGAYPLMATALLAAGFVLAALRPGSSAERSPLMRRLVYLFVGQNVLLVVSSILRLDLYVAAYSLTMLRVAAFIWMGLVAFGLVMIIARIALNRSNGWLVGGNLIAAGIVLYACSMANFSDVIARYNIRHAFEGGRGLDLCYLSSLGPQAVPAIDHFIAQRRAQGDFDGSTVKALSARRDMLAARVENPRRDWRSWSFGDHRLWRYLKKRRAAGAPDLKPSQPTEG
ncbi:DUF4173 domain-containing protein [Bosea caraganae]|uniref:DUF4173 domain-containing protein n=1 Tax=Bosea caraganae TaxID=2763117 RepID=A0A370L7B1_9HYPH|nr:DUF4173 domain-containing protein [Bosea caraganae]RDJ25492.1 DUF4173 domain-containing protein [Bosea caraganae]RDJ25722.1 DUF4173 domain-containing protein [Bosea caraganae]